MSTSHLVRTLLILLAVVLLATGAYYVYSVVQLQLGNSTTTPKPRPNVYQKVTETNPFFAQARSLFAEAKYAEALPLFQQALAATSDPVQQINIKTMIAACQDKTGDERAAINTYKSIASSTVPNTNRAHAFAIFRIGNIYYNNLTDKALEGIVFGDPRYASFEVKGDTLLSLRKLFEYSASFYPLAQSEMEIAGWYINQILKSQRATTSAGKLSSSTIADYQAQIKQLFALAEPDIKYQRYDPTLYSGLRATLRQKALKLSRLNEAGYMDAGSADDAFAEAMQAFAGTSSGEDGTLRYYYAVYLARMYGSARLPDIQSILSPLYSPEYASSSVRDLLNRHSGPNTFDIRKQDVIFVAKLDPQFKAYLMTLGWTAADFQ